MAEIVDKELGQLKNRLTELAEKSYRRGIYTYTPFLGLSQQQVFQSIKKELAYAGYAMEGGAPVCERKLVRFGNPDILGYEEAYPIACLKMMPVMPKFADSLTHRDFLGAIMNLGIERDTIGDIFLQKQGGILFCRETIASYLEENLRQVKHTSITCEMVEDAGELQYAQPENMSVTVSSTRIDGVIAKLYNISRSRSLELFRMGKVFVNGIAIENNSYPLKKDDAVTVRGYGKFLFYGQAGESKKGKERIAVGIFR